MIPRPEHPNPQWERKQWRNLNGEWEFEFDFSVSAIEGELFKKEQLKDKIIVPFCPESELSGIGYKDFIPAICYRKTVNFTKEDLKNRVMLHFGAVDYHAFLYVNGTKVGEHRGGYTPFEFDITEQVTVGENAVFLYVKDDVRSGKQCAGKQSQRLRSAGCHYTRTTGIWQTVWLEFLPKNHVKNVKYYPNITNSSVTICGEVTGSGEIQIKTSFEGIPTGQTSVRAAGAFTACIPLSEAHLWEVGKGGLYDVEITYGEDRVTSYFGLREVRIDGYKVLINGKSVFQRLVLDQGFYPDGIYTAPTEDALKKDIQISLDAGFNGARLHEKVFEPRFLYHADKMGYIVWGEYPNWGLKIYDETIVLSDIINGWSESVDRDFNHPSIVGWCPFNETWDYNETVTDYGILKTVYALTKRLDPTRPCIDTSGNYHVITDIYDVHTYTQDPDVFGAYFKQFGETGDFDYATANPTRQPFFQKWYLYKKGMPAFVSEYGGIKWDVEQSQGGWGYGNAPKTEEEFIDRYKKLTEHLLFNKNMFGFCYTQLYDVEQEVNGLYTYDRVPKFDMEIFQKINAQPAAIEE
ncbi:MAG: beta-galactosidase [Clostridia bacterium]|nr:beta-galactosidase [Clostridia bacterium]